MSEKPHLGCRDKFPVPPTRQHAAPRGRWTMSEPDERSRIKEEDPGMSSDIFDRAFEVAAAVLPRAPRRSRLAHPFGFDEHEPHEWRVSRDVWDRLAIRADLPKGDPDDSARLLGEPIRIDETLPTNSMLLEPSRG